MFHTHFKLIPHCKLNFIHVIINGKYKKMKMVEMNYFLNTNIIIENNNNNNKQLL